MNLNRLVLTALVAITLISLAIKIYKTDFLEPLFFDADLYNNFAWNFSHHLGSLPPLHNLGFPLLLSPLFVITPDFMSSSIIQKAVSVVFSTLTIPVFYKLSRRFLDQKYSLIATCLIAFEPHLITNSTFGITEPQYLFLFVTSLFLGTSKNQKHVAVSFVIAGLAMITRFEGIVLLPLLSGLWIYRNKISIKSVSKLGLFAILFLIPIISITYYNIDTGTRENVITAKVTHEEFVATNLITQHQSTVHKIFNSILYLGWSTYPMFILFIPFALFFVFKTNKRDGIIITLILALLAFPGIFAYFRAYDTRYFIQLYPILAILSAYAIKEIVSRKWINKILDHEEIVYLSLVSICVISAMYLVITSDNTPIAYASTKNNTIVIFPTYTLAAYDRNGFYDFYKGQCDVSCLTIQDRFNDISKIEYHAYGIDTFKKSGFTMISDRTLDDDPTILKQYHKIIVLHNEYVTQKEFTALTNSKNVIYLYPNALYAIVQRNPDNTLTLIRGHNYPSHDITNGFNWQYDNSNIEYDRACKNIHFYTIPNGTMLNCYPEDIINTNQELWNKLRNLTQS